MSTIKVVTWNVRRAKRSSDVWKILLEVNPDIATLQEVGDLPEEVASNYQLLSKTPRRKDGGDQRFTTVILTKGELDSSVRLRGDAEWVNKEATYYDGNIIYCRTKMDDNQVFHVVSVYSPAWHIPKERLAGTDISSIKLDNNQDLYLTEIMWSLLKNAKISDASNWIVGGDLNSSVTFDSWGATPRGNQEIIDRMDALGLVDCLSYSAQELVPTFRNPSHGNKFIHQLDYLYVNGPLLTRITDSKVLDKHGIFENSLSDHLPIVTEFD